MAESSSARRGVKRGLAIGLGGLLAAGLAVGGSVSAQAASATANVTLDQFGADRAAGSSTGWWVDRSNAGDARDGVAFDGSAALQLSTPSARDGVRALYTYGPSAERPAGIKQLLRDASYSYSGSNVNFQVEIFFTPKDETFGPTAADPANKCTPASVAGQCYTSIKWEPFDTSSNAWTTVDLSADTAADSSTGTGGWKNTNRVGTYAKPGALIGNTLTEYLDQMQDYTILAAGVAIGSGTANSVGYVRQLTMGGQEFRFAAGVKPPAPAPVANTDALVGLLADNNVDVAETTAAFVAPQGVDLARLDPTVPLTGAFPWQESSDDFVDVYAYSTPLFLGTFPVINGQLQLDGVDLAALAGGDHHIVFVGQQSKAVSAIAVTVVPAAVVVPTTAPATTGTTQPAASLAATGFDPAGLWAAGAAFLVLGSAAVFAAVSRRAQRG